MPQAKGALTALVVYKPDSSFMALTALHMRVNAQPQVKTVAAGSDVLGLWLFLSFIDALCPRFTEKCSRVDLVVDDDLLHIR